MADSLLPFRIFLWGFFVCLILICYFDINKRIIPNKSVVILFICLLFSNYYGYLNFHFESLLSIFVIGLLLWKFRVWGAGDVKLIAVLSLFISPSFLLTSILVILVVGGGVALCELVMCKVISSRKTRGVPYGVAICVGGCVGILASIT